MVESTSLSDYFPSRDVRGEVMMADLHKAICAIAGAAILSASSAFGAHPAQLEAVRPAFADDPSPALWRNVRFGMTLAEVRMLVPQGHAPTAPDRLLSGEALAVLETAGTLEGRPSQVRFYFTDDDKLLMVVETMKDRALSFDIISRFVQDMSARLGPARDCSLKRDTLINGCIWLGRSLTVTMSALILPEKFRASPDYSSGSVTVNYMSTAYYRSTYPLH